MTTDRDGGSGELIVLSSRSAERPRGARSAAIRVLLADAVGLVRAGFRALLEGEADITVVAEAASGEQALVLISQTRPDVLLVDIHLPRFGGVKLTRRILADPDLSHTKVLILSSEVSDEGLFAALRAGASGVLLKDAEPSELLRAVRVLANGGAQLSPAITRRVISEFACQPDPNRAIPEHFEELTAREREVVTLVAMGLSNTEIADQLDVSPATAKTHVSRAMIKLHAHDRAPLVALAYQTGFIQPRRHTTNNHPNQTAQANR
jgi:DNA-binding NarL/FixJ family response regulator